jgi:phage portal protein BeeE
VKFLDALVKSTPTTEQRYSFSDWVNEYFSFGGSQYPLGLSTTYGIDKTDPVADTFMGFVNSGLKGNSVVASVERVRLAIFTEARFQFQRLRRGKLGDLFGTEALRILEQPWVGGTTGDLLGRMLLDADLAGNSYTVVVGDELVRLRPDWVELILADRVDPFTGETVGYTRAGYAYYHGGMAATREPVVFLPEEVAHFAPNPDPLASYVGMSWLTPVIREMQADTAATKHKLKFFENAATPNLAVSLAKEVTPAQFRDFVELMDSKHAGVENAYKTLYTAGGADVTVIGADLKQLDFKVTQGHGETRIASAGGIHPVVAGLSEGMQGSSLNAGNFSSARRIVADVTFRPLWRNVSGSIQTLVPPPADARLWVDTTDIGFLREDRKDQAEIQGKEASTIRQLLDAGYEGDSVTAAVISQDWKLLKHSGLFSVQLQPPGTNQPDTGQDNDAPEEDEDDGNAS